MPTFNSAGPKAELVDLSMYVSGSGSTVFGIVGPATKGDVNVAIVATSPTDFIAKLGEPEAKNYAALTAIETLKEASTIIYVRVADPATLATASHTVTYNDGGTDQPFLTFEGKTPGTWANKRLKLAISNSGTAIAGDSKSFRLTVVYDSTPVEVYDVSTLGTSPSYIETALEYSEYIKVVDALNGVGSHVPANTTAGSYLLLDGGANGTITDTADADFGKVEKEHYGSSGSTKGIEIFNQTYYEVDVLAVPNAYPEVYADLIAIAERRGDCLVVVDPANNMTPEDVLAWSNKTGSYASGTTYNSMHCAIFWPWITGYADNTNKISYDVPPSTYVLPQIAYNDKVSAYWWAPAGLKRGKLTRAKGLKVIADTGTLDMLYGGSNVVNPLAQFPGDGVVIWGQKTTQRLMSATNRINVARLIMKVRRIVLNATRYFTFDQNDRTTWDAWKNTINPEFANIKSLRGLYDYQILMDETTVTPAHIDRLEMPGKIFVQPTKAAEFIPISFIITPTGVKFE